MNRKWTSASAATLALLVASCGAAPHRASQFPEASTVSEAELDPRLERSDAIAVAQFDRVTGFRYAAPSGDATHVSGTAAAQPSAAHEESAEANYGAAPAPDSPSSTPASESESGSEEDDRCENACGYRDQICDLASRICSISEANPTYDDIAARCTDGQSRCQIANRSLSDCDC
ncbi:MAG: hypothetical protein IPK60_21855 [Sandaracinaceae bacterium]|jgi:hypothetical protein|nr:hypothetical protein [Sandaracinaceae bacterium]